MDKKELRTYVRNKKRQMTETQIEACSDILTEQFLQSDLYRNARSIYSYLSYNQEVRTRKLMEAAIRDGKRVAVPKVFGETSMKFLWLDDLDAVALGYCKIPEPIADGPEADDETALILMPGLAFDKNGGRCGYGGGFYDRFLEAEPNHPTIALCYGFQMFPEVQRGPYDIPVDQVLWADVPEE